MDKKMICKECGEKKHYCSSCGYDSYLFEGYCDRECFEKSVEYKTYSTKLQRFYDSLTDEQQLELWSLWDNGIFIDDKFEVMVDKIVIDPRKESL